MADVLKFSAVIQILDVNPYVAVTAARAAKIKSDWRKPLPVRFRINGEPKIPWRINMMPMGDGGFYLYLHGGIREASGTKVGDRVQIEVVFDEEYKNGPAHSMPREFSAALGENPQAKRAWTKLIPSRKKELLRYFSGLKSAEAKARNLSKALRVLSGAEERFLGRLWKSGK